MRQTKLRSRPNTLKMSQRLRREVYKFIVYAPIAEWNREHCRGLANLLFDHMDKKLR